MRLIVLAVSIGCVFFSAAGHRAVRASEVHVDQAHGRVSAGAVAPTPKAKAGKPPNALVGTPEGAAPTVSTGSPTTPVTCNQQNYSSPACYSATQQARPAGK